MVGVSLGDLNHTDRMLLCFRGKIPGLKCTTKMGIADYAIFMVKIPQTPQ